MLRFFRVKQTPINVPVDPSRLTGEWLSRDSSSPISLKQINDLDTNIKRRVYRNLLPPSLLSAQNIDPINWSGVDGDECVRLSANPGSGYVTIFARKNGFEEMEFFRLEFADNAFNGIDIHILVLNDPNSRTFHTDVDENGKPTSFGTVRRNIAEEIHAKQHGLAPGQVRSSLGASRVIFEYLDNFMSTLGQQAYFMEPLTYASAWIFEKRGCAYVRGHQIMDQINQEFQPGGELFRALDGSSSFRKQDQWNTVRGRAWAIHDNILEKIDRTWDDIRMVKQVGKHAGVNTFPDSKY